jgi:DNA-binding beta-propeller fold protein YncE
MSAGVLQKLIGAALAALAFTLVVASSALAESHPFVGEFGAFTNPNGIAVDEATGDVYVADIGTDTVSKFNAKGEPVEFAALHSDRLTGGATPAKSFSFPEAPGTPAAIAVDNSTSPSDPSAGDLYVLDQGHGVVDKFSPDGELLYTITGIPSAFPVPPIVGVAVANSGDLLIDEGPSSVRRFDDSRENVYLNAIEHDEPSVDGFAADRVNELYVLQACGCVQRYDGESESGLGIVDSGTTDAAVAVDQATGHVFVDEQSAVSEWDAGEMKEYEPAGEYAGKVRGVPVSSFGSMKLSAAAGEGGLAVNGRTGEVYVANPAAGMVDVFGTSAPGVAVNAPTGVSKTAATLRGAVNPHGTPVSSCVFEYGTSGAYGHTVECAQPPGQIGAGTSSVSVSAEIGGLSPGVLYHYRLQVTNAAGSDLATGLFATSGPGFGIKNFEVALTSKDGSPDTQAGSHPYAMTTNLEFNTTVDARDKAEPDGNFKDLVVDLPPGLIGDPAATGKCTLKQLDSQNLGGVGCPAESQLGVLSLVLGANGTFQLNEPVYNLVPPRGVALQIGAHFIIPNVFINVGVPGGGDYGARATVTNPSIYEPLIASRLTVWGVPQDPSHDGERQCPGGVTPCADPEPLKPLLTLPTACMGPLVSTASADSYEEPGRYVSKTAVLQDSSGQPLGMAGCSRLVFPPTISVSPDSTNASTSSGLTVGVHVPQTAALNPEGLAESTLRDTTVTLPEGVAVNPSGGDGLEGCSEGLAGFTGFSEFNPESEPGDRTATFTETPVEQLQPGLSFCPDGSKIATAKIKTPLLPDPLEGSVYLASQNQNPFGSLLAMYLMVEDPVSGTTIKLPGEVRLTDTGQIVTTFKNTPALPFEDLELHFFGGERAPLTTPSRCGTYTTQASFVPWDGNGPVNTSSSFQITSGPNGGPCPGASLPFSPSLTGGSPNINAGGFSSLVTTISRGDGQQNMSQVTLHMPPGLSGLLSNVKLCSEALANEGKCGEESLIGETTVSAGVGPDPVSVKGGKVYITEKYHGAPFGLSIVNPVKAGPFDLEHDTSNPAYQPACDCIVVRARIEVDPSTAALTVTTNSEDEGYAIPHLIDGIPVQIKAVNVTINREHFTFNPTSCAPMSITGSISSDEGASSPVSVPFQATNCASLAFAPKFAVSTSGKTSKANGASLSVKLTYPSAPFGSQANIGQVKVELPKQLPSRLTTLQQACTAAQFKANPAGCPAASVVGYAKAVTPLIPVPLEGPAYFVSNGGEAFPNLIVVLQGYSVRIDLVGDTFIDKQGITSSTFKTVPDAPVGSFELTLPQGPFSALTANNTNLCALTRTVLVKKKVTVRTRGRKRTVTRRVKQTLPASLSMPTEFVAQNGMTLHQNTQVAVTGCPKAKAKAKPAKHKRKPAKKASKKKG